MTKTKTEKTQAEIAEEFLRSIGEAEKRTHLTCGNCGDILEAHGGEDGWVCRGADGTGCKVNCTEWVAPDAEGAEEAERGGRRAVTDPIGEDFPAQPDAKVDPGGPSAEPAEVVQPQAVDEPADEAPGTDIEVAGERPLQTLPALSAWQTIQGMAVELARSNLVSPSLRGKPADVQLILLAAHDLGITATQALAKIHVIEGKPSMSAELMVALVLRDGHRIGMVEATSTVAVAYGQRMRNGQPDGVECRMEFTIDEAKTAGLTSKDVWKKYPKAMLWARAVSQLCRMVFPDVLAGVSYVPEELGYIEAEGDEVAASGQQAPSADQAAVDADRQDFLDGEPGRKRVVAAIAALPEERKVALREEWEQLARDRKIHPPTQLRASEIEMADEIVARYRDAEPGAYLGPAEEAEIVTEVAGDAKGTTVGDLNDLGETAVEATLARVLEPEDAGEPEIRTFTCGGCGRVIQAPDSESKHAKGCADAPF